MKNADEKINNSSGTGGENGDSSATKTLTIEEEILVNVHVVLEEVLNSVATNCCCHHCEPCADENLDEDEMKQHKGILKHEKSYCNKHVDFDLALDYMPSFDPKKDYTIEIQFVETMPKKVVSYAALFAAQKQAKEEEALAAAEKPDEPQTPSAVKLVKPEQVVA